MNCTERAVLPRPRRRDLTNATELAVGSGSKGAAVRPGPPECQCEALQARLGCKWGSEPRKGCPSASFEPLYLMVRFSPHAHRQGLQPWLSWTFPGLCADPRAMCPASPWPLSSVTISDEAECQLLQGAFRAPPEQELIPTSAVMAASQHFASACITAGHTVACIYLFSLCICVLTILGALGGQEIHLDFSKFILSTQWHSCVPGTDSKYVLNENVLNG